MKCSVLREYTAKLFTDLTRFSNTSTPPPPGYCGAFARLFNPGGGAFENFALPGGRAFANPGAVPELLTRTRFPIRI